MIGPLHRAAIRGETIISIAINALIPTGIIWALDVTPPSGLTGAHGMLQGMAKGSGIATLLMTAIVTLLVRARVRRRPDLQLNRSAVPAVVAALPYNLALRSVIMAIVAMALLVPTGAVLAKLLDILPLTVGGFVLFNLAFGTLVGLTMTPLVVMRALTDRSPAWPH